MTRWIGAAAGLLLAPAAQAGLIPWQYSTTVAAADGSAQFVAGTPDLHTVVVATLGGGRPLTAAAGGAAFRLGEVTDSVMLAPDMAYGYGPGFRATVRVIDGATGAAAAVTFVGRAEAAFLTEEPDDGVRTDYRYRITTTFDRRDAVLDLGGRRYEVRVEDDLTATVAVADVRTTPEPATLASAAVGVALVLARAARRRRA